MSLTLCEPRRCAVEFDKWFKLIPFSVRMLHNFMCDGGNASKGFLASQHHLSESKNVFLEKEFDKAVLRFYS